MNFEAGYYCPRCEKRVYFAEEIIALGKHWHKSCFLCANPDCRKRLDSRTCADRGDDIYCTNCYSKLFGPRGYGYGVGAGTLQMESLNPEKLPSANKTSHSPPHSNSGFRKFSDPAPNGTSSPRSSFTKTSFGVSELCKRCGKTVYMAERMMAAGSPWHKLTCFTCSSCSKKLESTTLCEREGDIYCKTCYGKQFGPKGYGYGIGAGTLQMQQ